jgi:VanZ family protein
MKKILDIYDKCAEWLCSFTGDRYVHLIVGLLICYVVGRLDGRVLNRETAVAMAIGFLVAFFIAILKEVCDFFRGRGFDVNDLLFTWTGAIIGAILILI